MEVIFILITILASVTALKCRISIDHVIRWKVDCSAFNLSSAPPPMIIHPVISLNMSQNLFVHLTESQFINWTDISILDLSSNSINTVDKNAFKGLNNLTELYLNNNAIQVLSLNITNHLTKLKVLSISSNKLKSVESGVFDGIPLLYKLYLSHNNELGKITENLTPLKIALNKSLLTLGFENISLTEFPREFFKEGVHLIYLNLASNPLRNISDLPDSLRYLNISATSIDTISKDYFSNLHLVQKLSLESMPFLKEIKENSFTDLRNIEELYIRNCSNLSVISENTFSKTYPKLKKVDLSYCAFTTLPKTFKAVLSEVEYLDLQGNPWTCDGSISWILYANVGNLSSELRCENPPAAKGMLMVDYFKPRSLHPNSSLIRAAIVVTLAAVLVASVVAMVKQTSKLKVKTYRQLNDIRLEDRSPRVLPPL